MSTSTLIETPAAQDERATLLVGFELGKSSWLIGLYAPERGKTMSRHRIDGGDLGKVVELIAAMRRRLEKLGKPVRVVSIYEAGYDGLWLHRALRAAGVDNRVIDAASVPVDRRARRVETDRLDLEQLLRMLLALERGETRACRVVRVPSPAEEDAKRQHRERQVLVAERTGHGNRITGLLMAPGIRDVSPRRRDFVAHLQTLRTGDGEPLPPHTEQALRREHERLCLIERQIREIEAAQAAAIKAAAATPARQPEAGGAESGVGRAALLMRLKGLGQIGAVVLSREVFYRHFGNRREVASYFGLTPSPTTAAACAAIRGSAKPAIPVPGRWPSNSPGCGSDTNRKAPRPSGSWNGPARPAGASGASPSSPWHAS